MISKSLSLYKTFKNGDVNSGSTVSTVADLVAYVNGDTSFGSDITITASENGYYRSLQTVNYTQGNGTAGATSLYTGRSNNDRLWYKLGSGVVSGYVELAAGAGAQAIAVAVANAISDATHPTTGAFMYNAIANGATIELMNAINNLSDELTIIAIAHRYSTLKDYDRIFKFENGKILAALVDDKTTGAPLLVTKSNIEEVLKAQPKSLGF